MFSHVHLPGSERRHPSHSEFAGSVAPCKTIQITLLLRRKAEAPAEPVSGHHFSHAELACQHGADPADIEKVERFTAEHGIKVAGVHAGSRSVILEAPVTKLAEIFGADLRISEIGGKRFRTRQGELKVPVQIADCVTAVLGFDERPAAGTNSQVRPRTTNSPSFKPTEIASLYQFPSNKGQGQTIGLIELGGGYRESDLDAYWKQLGLENVSVTAVGVDGMKNAPSGNADSDDGEVVLDIEVAGAVAPGANIAVYFAANTDAGFLNAINAAVHDTVRKPSVISISWGSAEKEWTSQAMNAFNSAFHDAALLGISVCVAAGDNGSSDGEEDRKNHVDFPASSPWVLACGGTRLTGSDGHIHSETVWNDGTSGGATGGGVSVQFSKPSYQANAKVPKTAHLQLSAGRGVPDVAGVADPETGYEVLVDGVSTVVGGTSAVAPLWAGLIALCNEQLGKNLGWLHPTLYGTVAQHKVLNDITSGTNGAYKAGTGWDCCTGLGTPNGTALLNVLKQQSSAS